MDSMRVLPRSLFVRPAKPNKSPVAKFLVPNWSDIVDSGIGLSTTLCKSRRIPQSGTKNLASAHLVPRGARLLLISREKECHEELYCKFLPFLCVSGGDSSSQL